MIGVSERGVDARDHAIITRTPVHCSRPVVAREGLRLQFTAFDALYLERLQQGDPSTEHHFVTYFSELIRLKLRSRLNSRDAIEDVRQETFVRVLTLLRAKDGIRRPERLGALVNSICNHVLLEHYRSKHRVHASVDEQPEHSFPDHDHSVPDPVEADESARVIRKILVDLSERDRRLLQAVVLEERDKDEVCAELGLSREHLRVLVHRAKRAFKSFYLKHLGEPG